MTNSNPVCSFCGKEVEPVEEYYWGELKLVVKEMHEECESLEEEYKRAGLPKIFWKDRKFDVEDGNKLAYEAISNQTPCLLMSGAGTGKTMVLVELAKNLLKQEKRCKFVNVPKLLFDLKCNFDGNSRENETILSSLERVDNLILDDLGAEKASEWVTETIYILINSRYENMLPTFISTNCTMPELSDRLGDRVASRLVEMCKIIKLNTKDRRLP